MQTIKVSIPHRLGRDVAKQRLQAGAAGLRTQFAGKIANFDETWTGHHADFKLAAMGQSITGKMDIEDAAINLSIEVPWMLAMLADKIKGKIETEGRKLLERKK